MLRYLILGLIISSAVAEHGHVPTGWGTEPASVDDIRQARMMRSAPAPTASYADDLVSRMAAADDFGHSVHYVPSKVYYPTSDEQISEIVHEARSNNDQITVRGVGHSTNGQAQCCGCIVIDMRNMNKVRNITEDFVYVEAGAKLDVAYTALAQLNKTTVTQTDWPGLTVGGVISGSGGSGPGLFRHGPLADSVLELTMVTGNGDIVVASPTENSDLFNTAISSLGQFGVITAIKLRAVDIPGSKIRIYHIYQTLDQVFETYEKVLDEEANGHAPFHQFKSFPVLNQPGSGVPSGYPPSFTVSDFGVFDPWVFIQEIGIYFDDGDEPDDQALFDYFPRINGSEIASTSEYTDWIYRLDFLFNVLLPSPGFNYAWMNPHPWFGVILPFEEAKDYVNNFFLNTPPEDAPFGSVQVMNTFVEPAVKNTFKPLPDSEIDRLVYVAILRQVDMGSTSDIYKENARLTEVNRVHRINAEMIGGVPYLTSMIPSSKQEWSNLSGFDLQLYKQKKALYDPSNIFQPLLTSMILGKQDPCEKYGGGQFAGTI